MAKLSDFYKSQDNSSNEKQSQSKVNESQIKDKFNTYKDMSSEQLNSELFKEVARQKSQGTFDYAGLERMVQSLQGICRQNNTTTLKGCLKV